MSNPTALIVGRGPESARAALDVAEAGVRVTLLTPVDGLCPGPDGSLGIPSLLDVTRHPRVELLTGATLNTIGIEGTRLRATIRQAVRYVDPVRCTACGACAEVCPVSRPSDNGTVHPLWPALTGGTSAQDVTEEPSTIAGSPQKAIYRGGVPTTYVIDKAGTSPCRYACPIHQRAQGYIALVRAGNFGAAYHTIKRENPFPSVCGRVCNHRCEDVCSRGKVDAPVNIAGLKRFVADWMWEQRARGEWEDMSHQGPEVDKPAPTGNRVAVVGAGPAGLTCALELVRQGHGVTVYEALPVAGGMMQVGVPEYRLPHDVVQAEINDVLAEGVDLVLSHRVENVLALLQDGFDAVFVAVGAHEGVRLPIPGVDLPEVLVATDFLRAVSLRNKDAGFFGETLSPELPNAEVAGQRLPDLISGRRVLVLGGGNVAVDAAMTAGRLGAAWIGMACLESREEMPAHDWEIQDAEQEGIEVFPSRTFKEITGCDGHVAGVRCAQVDFRGFDNGRPDFDEQPDTEQVILADVVIFAIGQRPQVECLQGHVEMIRGRFPAVDSKTLATSVPGVFAGGDAVTGTAFIVDAILAGQKAARSIDHYLRRRGASGLPGRQLAQDVGGTQLPPMELDEAQVRHRLAIGQSAQTGRVEAARRPAHERRQDFGEIYDALTEAEARAEAARCFSCGTCSECLQCEQVCLAGAISHERQPQTQELSVDAVAWAATSFPPSETWAQLPGFFAPEDGISLADTVDQTLAHLGLRRFVAAASVVAPSRRQVASAGALLPFRSGVTQFGVFLCRCGGEIEKVVDLSAVTARIKSLPGLTFVGQIDFACHAEGSQAIRSMWADQALDGAVLAACSCCALDQICYSCTTQRTRCKERLGVWDEFGDLALQFVNVREQCAFVHRDNPDAATRKAGDLITASVAALSATGVTDGGSRVPAYGSRTPITAAIDLVRCRGCEDCEVVCGLHAVQVVANNGTRMAQVDPTRCLGCGVCMAVCSSGAILASDSSDAQVAAQLSAMGDLTDKTVIFSCNWGAYSAVEAAAVQRLNYDPSVRLVRLMCSGRTHVGLIMQSFVQGAARVLVLTCGYEDGASRCHYQTGNDQARRSAEQAQGLLKLLGIDPTCFAVVEMRPGDGARFVATVDEFVGAPLAVVPKG